MSVPTRLLVLALVGADGVVDAGELYDVAAELGMSDQQVRLCVKRLVAEGRFTHEGRGRAAVLRAVPGRADSPWADAAYVRHAFRQDAGLEPWDGRWRLFGFAVPESARATRDAFRETLRRLGAAPVQGGLYASPNPITAIVRDEAARLGVGSLTALTTGDLSVGGTDDPRALAAALWPLGEIAARYDRIAACRPGTGPAAAVELAAAFSAAMEPDPLLPPELLPRPWPGASARAEFARRWRGLGGTRLFPLYEVLGAGHRDVGDAVLHELRPADAVAEAGVEPGGVGLGGQDGGRVADGVHGRAHEVHAQAAAARVLGGAHAADAFGGVRAVVEDAEVAGDLAGLLARPHVEGRRFGVPPVEVGVRALLLDDEDVHAQAEDRVEGEGVQFGEGPGLDRGHGPIRA